MIEVRFKKHVRILFDLEVGEKVRVDDFHYKVNGIQTITDIKESIGHSESGFLIKITNYDSSIDSNWVDKI